MNLACSRHRRPARQCPRIWVSSRRRTGSQSSVTDTIDEKGIRDQGRTEQVHGASLPFWSMHPGNLFSRPASEGASMPVVKRFEASGAPFGLARVRLTAVRIARRVKSCILSSKDDHERFGMRFCFCLVHCLNVFGTAAYRPFI